MNIETTIQKITDYDPAELFGEDVDPSNIVAEIRMLAMAHVPDLTTDAGRKHIASMAAKVAKAKTAIDAAGKAKVEPLKAEAKLTDNKRKRYRDELDALKAEVRKPLTEWEEARAKVEADQKQRLFELELACETTNTIGDVMPVEVLQNKLNAVETTPLTSDCFGAGLDKARHLVEIGTVKIAKAIETRKTLDAVAKQQAEANAETPAQRAEREREIAEKAAQAERDKQAAEVKAQAAEDAKRFADAKHVRQVKNEAYQSLMSEVDFDESSHMAVEIVNAICAGKIKHVRIQF